MTLWRYVIPAATGEVVLVHGADPESVGLPSARAFPATSEGDSDVADHVLAVVRRADDAELVELAHRVRPGGTLIVAMPSILGARRSLRSCAAGLRRAGVEVEQYVWLGGTWQVPSSVVPADAPSALSWFVDQMFVPWSRRQWLGARVVRSTRGRAGAHLLFPGMAVVGRRVPDEGRPT